MRKRPDKIEESVEVSEARRARLDQLIQERGGMSEVAAASGIDRVHLEKLTTQKPTYRRDILSLRADTIAKLLDALQISDDAAIRELNIPPTHQKRWRTLREAPMGQKARDLTGHIQVLLKEPLAYTLQPGFVLTVDQHNILSGDILTRLNGRILILPADALPEQAEALGQIVLVDTLVRRPVPGP
ncbi:helix-turn-helix domain-containing protein [Deinococcus ruber]|uniref:Uncharacterized protein n=1 Tax=Deinococcus ruber TaxID=1848197 RepID=A0A918CCX8_9DEIO|nr:helix-turn-helix transcriptional regulator [Deinococcus ruber]GGR16415.1 hypothetical protein GCM10008957_31330 [Deinococcus ruber]